jgi:hypothetical protein
MSISSSKPSVLHNIINKHAVAFITEFIKCFLTYFISLLHIVRLRRRYFYTYTTNDEIKIERSCGLSNTTQLEHGSRSTAPVFWSHILDLLIIKSAASISKGNICWTCQWSSFELYVTFYSQNECQLK